MPPFFLYGGEIMPRVSELITQSYLNGDAGLGQLPAPFENRFDEVNAQLADIAINIGSLGARDAATDPAFDNKAIFDQAFALLPNGGTVILPTGKVFVTDTIQIPSGITLDLNGSTLKLKSGVAQYHNVVNIGGVTEAVNVTVRNGKIDGNRTGQTEDFYHYGIYILTCNGVTVEDVEIVSCDGEGLYIGYTGFLARNVNIRNIKLSDNTRNDWAIVNVNGLYADTIIIDSIAYNSASVDFEFHGDGDSLRNIYINNLSVHSNVQPVKMLTNDKAGTLENINISNITLTGTKGLAALNFDNVKITNLKTQGPIEFIGCENFDIGGLESKGVTGNGVYVYPSAAPSVVKNPKNITMTGLDISGASGTGFILQGVKTARISALRSYNNGTDGIGVFFNNDDVWLTNVVTTDTRSSGKTQKYGINFQGTNTKLSFINVIADGNLTGSYQNFPIVAFEVGPSVYRYISPDGLNSFALALDNLFNLRWPGQLQAKRYCITAQTASASVNVGEIFEDTDGGLKYVNRAGVLKKTDNRVSVPASASATGSVGDWAADSSYFYICHATNTWKRVGISTW